MNDIKSRQIGLVISGGIIGAVVGIIAAILFIKSSEDEPRFDSKQGLKLGLGIVSLLRSLVKGSDR
jgi:hypothetical protein